MIPEMSAGKHSNVGTILFAVGFTLMMVLDLSLIHIFRGLDKDRGHIGELSCCTDKGGTTGLSSPQLRGELFHRGHTLSRRTVRHGKGDVYKRQALCIPQGRMRSTSMPDASRPFAFCSGCVMATQSVWLPRHLSLIHICSTVDRRRFLISIGYFIPA